MNYRRNPFINRCTLGLVLCATLGFSVGCTRIPLTRKLPETIRSIYVPLAENRSYEPGIEEELTREIQLSLLQEGQLRVRNSRQADMQLGVVLRKWIPLNTKLTDDKFPERSEIVLIADAYLYNTEDRARTRPVLSWEQIQVEFQYYGDLRRVTDQLPVDARKDALKRLADEIVKYVIYEDAQEILAYREKQAAGKIEQPPRPPRDALP